METKTITITANRNIINAIEIFASNENCDLVYILCDTYGLSLEKANELVSEIETEIKG